MPSAKTRNLAPEARLILEVEPPTFDLISTRSSNLINPQTGREIPDSSHELGVEYRQKTPGTLIEIRDVPFVTTTTTTDGKATASIALASHRDSLYNKARKNTSKAKGRQAEISEYLTEVLNLSSVNEINPRRRELKPGVRRIVGLPLEKLGFLAKPLLYVIGAENGRNSSAQPPKTRGEEYAGYEWFIADWRRMRRVWIDFRDMDGDWVAGMTGFVSSIQDVYRAGDTPMVNISCQGMMRYLELTEFITRQSSRNLEWPFRDANADFPINALSNSLAGLDAQDIMKLISEQVNYQFCLTGDDAKVERKPEDYFYHDLLVDTSDPVGFGEGAKAINPSRIFNAGTGTLLGVVGKTTTDDLRPKLIIDPEIVRLDNRRLAVYREAFQMAFQFYSFENTSAFAIGKDAAQVTNYEFFEDPKGNITLWAPRYDALPRVHEGDIQFGELIGVPSPGGIDFQTTRFGDNYSTIPFHDERYIIDDVGLLSWNFVKSEGPIKTFTRVTNHAHLLDIGPNMTAETNTGYTSFAALKDISEDLANEVVRLARRFGVRRHSAPVVHTGSAGGETKMLTRFAYAHLVRMNAYSESGSVGLLQRPELWPGRSVLMAERQKLGYITQVTNELRAKEAHKTTLTLSYVHHPLHRIGQPWFEATLNQSDIPKIETLLAFEESI